MLHASESNTELAISPKKIISSMLAPIPVIDEKMICECSLPLLSLRTVNLVTHSCDTSSMPTALFADD
jgi:hypothetical protein